MFIRLNLLLLICFINYRGTTTGNILIHVTGREGENATLPCDIEARDIFHLILSRLSKNILDCQNERCKSENGRVLNKGSCDITIKDLRLRDAGKYILRVYYTNTPVHQIKEYHLHIHDEISVNSGEELKLDVLLTNADKVETNSSDTGTYRVLDSDGEILITVTVTESNTGSDSKTTYDKPDDTEHTALFLSVGLPVLLVLVLVGVIMFVVFKKPQCLNGGYLPGRQSTEQSEGL